MTRKTFPIELNGQTLQLDFDWVALAEIYDRFGATTDLFNPKVLREVVMIGLGRHHPEIDQAFADKASPPIIDTIAIVDRALRYAYDGIDSDAPDDVTPKRQRRDRTGNLNAAPAN